MVTQLVKRTLFSKIIATVVSIGFVLSSVPISYANSDALRPMAAKRNPGVTYDFEHEAMRSFLARPDVDARNEKHTVRIVKDANGEIHIQAVEGMAEEMFKQTGRHIGGHYAIRPDANGITYIYIDKDTFEGINGELYVAHELYELRAIRAFAKNKGWTFEDLVEWLDEIGNPAEVERVLAQIHDEAPELPEEAVEIVSDIPLRIMLARAVARAVRGAAVEDKEVSQVAEAVFPNKIPAGGKVTVGGNWKLRPDIKTEADARAKAREFRAKFTDVDPNAEVVLFVQDKWMKAISKELEGSNIKVGVQSFHFDPAGDMQQQIADAVNNGAKYAMVGHSMHRYPNDKQFPPGGETKKPDPLTNKAANKIVRAILADGRLKLWYVIGINDKQDSEQPLAEQEPQIKEWIFDAITTGLDRVSEDQLYKMIITAEPMSAISTKTGDGIIDTKTYVDFARVEMLARHSTDALMQKFGISSNDLSEKVNLGYGATAGPGTAEKLLSDRRISNILPGGMSLEADNFYGTVTNAIKGSFNKATVEFAQKLKIAPADALRIAKASPSPIKAFGGASTVRLDMELAGGAKGYFVVPAGTSSGTDEAPTVMNKGGFGQVVNNIKEVIAEVIRSGLKAGQVVEIGKLMLGMGKDRLGAETTLSVQMASAWAAASQQGLENYEFIRRLAPDLAPTGVPRTGIQYNITNGGQHAKNSLDIQEFMVKASGRTTAEKNQMCDKIDRQLGLIYQALGLKADPDDQGIGPLRGKEGGYKIEDLTLEKLADIYANIGIYDISNLNIQALKEQNVGVHEFVLNCLLAAIKDAGYEASTSGEAGTVALALDSASTSMLVEGHDDIYNFEGRQITSAELIGIYAGWAKKYPIESIEDGLGENDWEGWIELIKALGDDVTLIVDDLTVTQGSRLTKLIRLLEENGMVKDGKVTKKLAILIKLNQNGFLTTGINNPQEGYLGTLEVIRLAKQYGIDWIVSHRSNEAEPEEKEVSIAELAAGTNAIALKSGDHVQAVRAVKEDRLAAIDARERMMVDIAQKLNVEVEKYRGYLQAEGTSYDASGGIPFEGFVNSLKPLQIDGKTRVLIITPNFFKIGGVKNVLSKVDELNNVEIAVYGDKAEKLKTLVGKDIITAKDLDSLLAELPKLNVEPQNILLLSSPEDKFDEATLKKLKEAKIRQIVAPDIATLGVAKAVKELMGNEEAVRAFFGEFYLKLAQAGVISQETYDSTRKKLLEKLQEATTFEFPEDVKVAEKIVSDIKEAKQTSEEFIDQI